MKKHLSVLMLFVRSTLYKVLALLALLAGAQAVLFHLSMGRQAAMGLSAVIEGSYIQWVFGVIFLLVTVVLCRPGCDYGSRQGYTLRRLSVSEKWVFGWQALCNTGMYLLLWAAEAGILLALSQYYISGVSSDMVSGQTLFLATWQNLFFHGLLPLEDTTRWLANGWMCLCLGITSAGFPYRQRRRKWPFAIIYTAAVSAFVFCREMLEPNTDAVLSLLLTLHTGFTVFRVLWEEDDHEA